MRKKILTFTVILIMLLTALLAGCGFKRTLFSCNSENHIGLKSVYASLDGRITICLDKKYAVKGDYPYGQFKMLFEEEEYPEGMKINITAKDGTKMGIDAEDITIDGDEYTISFPVDGTAPDDIQVIGVHPTLPQYCEIDIVDGVIKTETGGGEATSYVIQMYDKKDDFWNDLETEIKYYPLFGSPDGEPKMLATREYFENLDKDTSLNTIVEDIGGYGIEGSGILYHVWKLDDGSKAMVVFDSNGYISMIYIDNGDYSERIYKREY